MAVCYKKLEKYDKAVEVYEKALEVHPTSKRLHHNLAITLAILGKGELADDHISIHQKLNTKK